MGFGVFLVFFVALHSCSYFQFRVSKVELATTMSPLGYKVEDRTLSVGNQELRYAITGNPNGQAFMLIHGSPSSLLGWKAIYTDTSFLSKYKLVLVDRPGYGYSDFGNIETDIQKQANVITKLIDTLKLDRLILLGSSYGGPVAAQIAMNIPHKIQHLLFVSSSVKPKAEKTYWISYPMTTPVVKYIFPAIFRMSSDEKLSHANQLLKIADWDKITSKTSVIHGDKDELIYFANATFLLSKIPQAKLYVMKNKGHAVIFSDQLYFKSFLKGVL